MKNKSSLVLSGMMAFFCAGAFAADIPAEIYRPADAEVVKADKQGNGEFEAGFRLHGRDVRKLAGEVRRHALGNGFKLVESSVNREDADLKFKRREQELNVSIEHKGNGRIEYDADLDLNKN